ncbi:MAG: hypothetical protein QOF48_2599 [Verrucomicrobiota bacterium]|jgi:hypothetical protein
MSFEQMIFRAMHPHLKSFSGALLVLTLYRSEVPAQNPDSGANPPARVPPQKTVPPMPPVPPSPVGYFRKLIDAAPAEREKLLEGKSPEQCRVLTNSLRTYLELSASDRELRLRTLELRSYLGPLLQTPVTNRAEKLAAVPEVYRELVREGLAAWDSKPPADQQRLLESERAVRLAGLIVPPMPPMPPNFSIPLHGWTSNQVYAADKALKNWQAYPVAKQAEIVARFERVSTLPQPKKDLGSLPLTAAEREQMEKTLEKYRSLPAMQRGAVLGSFKKFAELPLEERRQFLRNAEAWQAMSPEDRERWRHLVNNLPPMPPLPPGFGAPLLPPMPPPPSSTIRTDASTTLLVTNR